MIERGKIINILKRQVEEAPAVGYLRLCEILDSKDSFEHKLSQTLALVSEELGLDDVLLYLKGYDHKIKLFRRLWNPPTEMRVRNLTQNSGLVGHVVDTERPLMVQNLRLHPSYDAACDEDKVGFKGFLGTPLFQQGSVVGSLVGLHTHERSFSETDLNFLQIVCTCLSSSLVKKGLKRTPQRDISDDGEKTCRFVGDPFHKGIAIGKAFIHQIKDKIHHLTTLDPDQECLRLDKAHQAMKESLKKRIETNPLLEEGECADILKAYTMFSEDPTLLGRIKDLIREGLSSESAIQKVRLDTRKKMNKLTDAYIRERLTDFEDIISRLLHHLESENPTFEEIPKNSILFAEILGPAELLDYTVEHISAIVLSGGSRTCHAAIIAKALDIPMIGGVKGVLEGVQANDDVIVDCDNSQVILRPIEEVAEKFRGTISSRKDVKILSHEPYNTTVSTLDGVEISLYINVGFLADLIHLRDSSIKGVGLYRTEVPFMLRKAYPDLQDQIDLYQRAFAQSEGKDLIFRTLDIGGEKHLPYMDGQQDENPAMGWRAIRIGLDHPAMLRQQIRALLYAASGQRINILIPMLADLSEFHKIQEILKLETDRLHSRSIIPPHEIRLGVMLEVPALMWQLSTILEAVDFVSIGSNDLFQFMFALDRGSSKLAGRYDTLSTSFLSLIKHVVVECRKANKPLFVCGDMVSQPLQAMALIGLGIRNISVPPTAIFPIKQLIASLELHPLESYMDRQLTHQYATLSEKLRFYAMDHEIEIQ